MGDIDTGSVYKQAYQEYINPDTLEVSLPNIFFIEKTHINFLEEFKQQCQDQKIDLSFASAYVRFISKPIKPCVA